MAEEPFETAGYVRCYGSTSCAMTSRSGRDDWVFRWWRGNAACIMDRCTFWLLACM
ncbi:hypothetical protein DAI22_12g119400 [Oryza sativa Japonica Group]|nr:hypothetical protein DAI22_12g119400 [Oryza sativa Japonica Group]